ncbi:hypothetical protein FQA39_LY14814 [Lamprigera yunnana]|nr:hypothetical protein FQA39_LY14814 [Lamprigera yunnana]
MAIGYFFFGNQRGPSSDIDEIRGFEEICIGNRGFSLYLEDKPLEGGPLEDEPEHRQSPSCSSSTTDRLSIGIINKRDLPHGPVLAIAHFRECSF